MAMLDGTRAQPVALSDVERLIVQAMTSLGQALGTQVEKKLGPLRVQIVDTKTALQEQVFRLTSAIAAVVGVNAGADMTHDQSAVETSVEAPTPLVAAHSPTASSRRRVRRKRCSQQLIFSRERLPLNVNFTSMPQPLNI